MSIGDVLQEGWALYTRLFGRSVVVAGLIFLVVSLADALASTRTTYATGLVIMLGYLWMLWDPRDQTWHDKAARSVPVYEGY